jgi:hypothetical protein
MRTLSADLLAAQRSASSEPRVEVTVENLLGGMRRLDFTLLDNTAQTIARHGIAVAGDGSVTRARSDGAGTIMSQRVANPGAGPWNSWSALTPAGKGPVVAAPRRRARRSGLRRWRGNRHQAAPSRSITPDVCGRGGSRHGRRRARGPGSRVQEQRRRPRDRVVDGALNIVKRTADAFGPLRTPESVTSLNGIGMCYGFDWDIALTGVSHDAAAHVGRSSTATTTMPAQHGVRCSCSAGQADSAVAYSAHPSSCSPTPSASRSSSDTLPGQHARHRTACIRS